MGNNQHQSYQQHFESKYAFNQLIQDDNFGQLKIYRKKQLNFDYVMVLQKYASHHELETLLHEIKTIFHQFSRDEPPQILRIFNYQVVRDKLSQCNIPVIRLYVQYFNFTLHDLMQQHAEKNDGFSINQIIYILNSILDTFAFFNSINPTYFNLDPKSIFITPQGWIKFSPIKVRDFFQEVDPLCKAILYQTNKKQITTFDKMQKTILSQIKKLMLMFVKLNMKTDIIALYEKILNCQSLDAIRSMIGRSNVDCLGFVKGSISTTESLDSFAMIKPYKKAKKMKI